EFCRMVSVSFYPSRTEGCPEQKRIQGLTGPHFRIGCDIGGTFTDFIVFDESTGAMHLEKCLTTPGDPSQGVMEGIRLLAERIPELLGSTSQVLHGTTLVINAVMERKGARAALLTTEGFRDVIAIGTER